MNAVLSAAAVATVEAACGQAVAARRRGAQRAMPWAPSLRPFAAGAAVPPASGLRLLVGGPGAAALRWSTDDDAPAARALVDGEVRLEIDCFELALSDVERCCRPEAGATGWRTVQAFGIGHVIESRLAGLEAGDALAGPMRVGTHLVIAPVRVDACAVESARGGLRWLRRTGRLASRVDAGGEAVERAFVQLRDRPHAMPPVRLLSLQGGHSSPSPSLPMIRSPCPS